MIIMRFKEYKYTPSQLNDFFNSKIIPPKKLQYNTVTHFSYFD